MKQKTILYVYPFRDEYNQENLNELLEKTSMKVINEKSKTIDTNHPLLPDYHSETLREYQQKMYIEFDMEGEFGSEENIQFVNKFFQQPILNKKSKRFPQWIAYPPLDRLKTEVGVRFTKNGKNLKHQYPIYIVSKGRPDNCKTAEFFTRIGINDFKIVIEEQEFEDYNKFYLEDNLLILDKSFQENYKTLDDLGLSKSVGPGPARNFCWEDSIKNGFSHHWVFDDNITRFDYYNNNLYKRVLDSSLFYLFEEYVKSHKNIRLAGLNYDKFITRKSCNPIEIKNTRIYSMLFIDNSLPFRWEGRYNEDTILSLKVLNKGWGTCQFNMLQGAKMVTQVLKGGNSAEFYFKEGTLPKSIMLVDECPNDAKLSYKFGRWHHEVNYNKFKHIEYEPFDVEPEEVEVIEYNFDSKKFAKSNVTSIIPDIEFSQEKWERLQDGLSNKSQVQAQKENIELDPNITYFTGFVVRERSKNKTFIIDTDFTDVESLGTENDIMVLSEYPYAVEIAKYCFKNKINMFDIVKENKSIEQTIQETKNKLNSNDKIIEKVKNTNLF